MLQEYVKSYFNLLAFDDLACNSIYTSPGIPKSRFYVEPCTRQKNVTVSMIKVAIPNLDVKVYTRKMSL